MTGFRLLRGRGVRLPSGGAGEAILVHDGDVVAMGETTELTARLPSGTACQVVHLDGYIIPGLRDSHLHPVAYTALLTGAPLHRVADIAELQQTLRAAAAGGDGLVTGSNFNETSMNEPRLPVAADLDEVATDRPVMVHRYDGHMAIVNTRGLEMAGISAATPDPAGGVIDRDAGGAPTGVLRETAIDLATSAPGFERQIDPTEVGRRMRALASRGITSIGAMIRSGEGPWAHIGDEVAVMTAAAPDIPIRIHGFVTADSPEALHSAAKKLDSAGELIDWAGVKRFADGSFGSHTAAMFEPFGDSPGTGTMRLNEDDIAMAHIAVNAGRSVAIHAIGDAAAGRVLDLFEHLVAEGVEPHRLRMEHASVLAADDIDRMGRLGVVASVQPAFLGSEVDWIEARVGPDRLRRTYAFASLLRSGSLVVGGSDSPVESPDPWEAMALCRDRAGLVLEEALSAGQALALYTTNAAKALGEPEPLSAGSPADFVVVEADPLEASPDELRATEVIATYVGGHEIAFDRSTGWWID